MAQDNTADTLNSLAKEVYSNEGVLKLVPEDLYLVKEVQFKEAQKLGRLYHQPVVLSDEHGFTYADSDDGLVTLEDSISLVVKSAEIQGSQLFGRSVIATKEAAIAVSNGAKSFVNATEFRVKALMDSAAKRLEIAMIYGRSAEGLARCVAGATVSSTQFRFTVPTSQWASGIWSGSINASLEAFNDTGTQIGSAAVSVYNVDFDNKYVFVTGASGDITAIDTAIGAGIVLRYKTANLKEMYGIDAIIRNTGTLFNISASDYPLWKGNTATASGAALTLEKLLNAMTVPLGKGLREDAVVLVSNRTFSNLNEDEAALRMFDSSYKPGLAERGNKRLRYHHQQGMLDVVAHNMVKEGEAFVLPLSVIRRVGACDLTFSQPGADFKMFSMLENKTGFQYRIYADQAILLTKPGICLKINNIVNT